MRRAARPTRKKAGLRVIQKMSFLQMVQDAFEKYEGEDVTSRRRKMEKEHELEFNDLPQFAQRAMLQQEIEINELKLDVQKTKTELKQLRNDLLLAQRNIQHLHLVIAGLGEMKLLK